MQIIPAHTAEYLPAIRELFTEYAETLDWGVCFRDFDRELAELPGPYTPPNGRLFLVVHGDSPVGCIGLRKLAEDVCEMKRLYVRPCFRGQGMGRQLAETLIRAARGAGYARMRLDTLPTMRAAVALYESLGFRRLPTCGSCGCGGAIKMEFLLR